jgi:hypothetical protein
VDCTDHMDNIITAAYYAHWGNLYKYCRTGKLITQDTEVQDLFSARAINENKVTGSTKIQDAIFHMINNTFHVQCVVQCVVKCLGSTH